MREKHFTRRQILRLPVAAAAAYLLPTWLDSAQAKEPPPDLESRVKALKEAYAICEPPDRKWKEEIGLCLSGGGYRAMLFHVGSLWRLYETGLLADCARITSVSGGSITAGVLALNWSKLNVDQPDIALFKEHLVAPVREMASKSIDVKAALQGIFLPGNISSKVEKYYKKYLFGDATFKELPDTPQFMFLATNLQSTVMFRFRKDYIGDYRVGRITETAEFPIAKAVAASSAFPPFLSPSLVKPKPGAMQPWEEGSDLDFEPYTTKIELSDGGVYDNLGLEPLKCYRKVLISDAGGKTQPEENPPNSWLSHSYRVLNVIDNQVRSLRKRGMIRDHKLGLRNVAYWSTRVNIDGYQSPHRTDLSKETRDKLAAIPTRLKAMSSEEQEGLINWGYISCDATVREFFKEDLPLPDTIPYTLSKTEI